MAVAGSVPHQNLERSEADSYSFIGGFKAYLIPEKLRSQCGVRRRFQPGSVVGDNMPGGQAGESACGGEVFTAGNGVHEGAGKHIPGAIAVHGVNPVGGNIGQLPAVKDYSAFGSQGDGNKWTQQKR